MMKIETLSVGPLQVNCYVVYDETSREAVVIDPGDDPSDIVTVIKTNSLTVRSIVCTHAHFDHVGAVAALKGTTQASIVLHRADIELYKRALEQAALWGYRITQPPDPDLFVKEGDVLTAGCVRLEVLHTPGHSPGGICLYSGEDIFSGDTVFAGSVGRTDFHGGDIGELRRSFRRIMSLSDDTRILPGHGEWTTVGTEKVQNFFMQEI